MEVYAGGRSQGKLEYVLKKKGLGRDVVVDGSNLKRYMEVMDSYQ